jgi:PAS domain S-box-containing protein
MKKSFGYNILDSAKESILIVELESKKIIYGNKTACELFKYNPDEILTLSIADFHPENKLEHAINIFKAQTSGEIDIAREIPFKNKNGDSFLADIYTINTDINGKPHIIAIFSDTANKKNTEKDFAVSQLLISAIFDAVPDLLIIIDKDFRIKYTNSKGHDSIKPPEGKKAETCYGRFKLLDSPCKNCGAKKVFETGEIEEREDVNPVDGLTREIRAFPIKNSSGEVIFVIEYVRDITEKKNAEENRIKLEQQIQKNQKLESLGVLAGGIAHDFNNLLSGIYGYIDIARENSLNADVIKYLDCTLDTMDRARDLTQQLLTFSKGGTPFRETEKLNAFLKDTVKFTLSGLNISCKYNVSDDLWMCDYDKNQIAQVIHNLIINAQQAMPVGGTIELTAENLKISENSHAALKRGNYVKISVKDTGIGIPENIQQKIFDPFFTTKQKGSGLGLATSYSIIKKHDGIIDFESIPGKGSTFYIILPASVTDKDDNVDISVSGNKSTGRILVMDDEEVIRNTMDIMLSKAGFNTLLANDGNAALKIFKEHTKQNIKIDIVILDLTVPGKKGGKEIIGEIRKLNKNIPVIVSSGYSEDPIIQNPLDYGFTDSIKKPFIKKELTNIISKYLH